MPWDMLPTPPPARINGFDFGKGDSRSVYFLQTSNGCGVEIVGEIRNVAREGHDNLTLAPPVAPRRRKIRF